MKKKCDRCEVKTEELFHPADDDCNEYYPDKEFCEICAIEIEDEEYDKIHPKQTEEQLMNELRKCFGGK